MLVVTAIKELKTNGVVVGYRLQDSNNATMDIKTEAIIEAYRANKVKISNLNIKDDNSIEFIQPQDKTETKPVEKPAQPEVKVQEHTQSSETTQENETDDIQRMKRIIKKLNEATKVYEQGKDEIMPNIVWDKLYDELMVLEQKTGVVLNDSPTVNVGYEVVSDLPKEKHNKKMLSLAKTKDKDELASFLGNQQGLLSWKLDGLTVVLTYEGGKLTKAVTRGNGDIGELVTPNAKQFKNIPRQIVFTNKLVLRGEAIIKYSTFEKINSAIAIEDDKYKNPRNLCSGSVRQLDSKVTAERNVEWYCFEVVECEGKNLSNNIDEQFNFLKVLGFDTVEYKVVNKDNIGEALKYFEDKVVNKSYDIPSDGLVITYRDKAYGLSLGTTSKTPKHSLAFKWEDETVESEIEYIEWSPSRTGLINPVAVFKPIDINGSTVSRASVHNVSIFLSLELGYGDKVSVYKANMIIPQILDNLTRSASCEIPSACPCCGGETEIHEEPDSGVLTLWCTDPDCPAKGNRLFEHFVSRDAMNIDGIGKSIISKFTELGILTDLVSMFHIEDYEDLITNLDGFGDKSFENMVNAIDKARDVKLQNLIYALGIPNIGLATANTICKHFKYDMRSTVTASYHDLLEIDTIGDVIAASFVEYFANEDNARQFVNLLKEVHLIEQTVSTNTSMSGVTICVTGDVDIFPNRRVIKDLVESLGGKLTGSVSHSTNYLVTNDTTSGSRKNKAAQEYGIPILTEKEFIDTFNLSEYI